MPLPHLSPSHRSQATSCSRNSLRLKWDCHHRWPPVVLLLHIVNTCLSWQNPDHELHQLESNHESETTQFIESAATIGNCCLGGKEARQRPQPGWFLGEARIDLLSGRLEPGESYLQKHSKLLLCGGCQVYRSSSGLREGAGHLERIKSLWWGEGGLTVALETLRGSCWTPAWKIMRPNPRGDVFPASITWEVNSNTLC